MVCAGSMSLSGSATFALLLMIWVRGRASDKDYMFDDSIYTSSFPGETCSHAECPSDSDRNNCFGDCATWIEGRGPVKVIPSFQLGVACSHSGQPYIQNAYIVFGNYTRHDAHYVVLNVSIPNGLPITFGSINNGKPNGLIVTGNGSAADYQNILNSVTFDITAATPSTDLNYICFWIITDTIASPARCVQVKTKLINNHRPVIHVSPTSETYVIGNPPVLIADSIQVLDKDHPQLPQFYMHNASITVRGNMSAQIIIDVEASKGAIRNRTADYSKWNTTVILEGRASAEVYSKVLSTARYKSSATELTDDHVIFDVTISDGVFTGIATIRLEVAVPILRIQNLYPGDRFSVTDRIPAIVASELQIEYVSRELQSLENATVEICQPGVCDDIVTYSPDLLFEQLNFTADESHTITARYFQSNGMDDFSRLRFSGSASKDEYEKVLRNVTYYNSRENVSSPASRVVKITASDRSSFVAVLVAIPILFNNTRPPVCFATDGVTNVTLDENGFHPNFSLSCSDTDMPSLLVLPSVNSRIRRSTRREISSSEPISAEEAMRQRHYERFTLAETKYTRTRQPELPSTNVHPVQYHELCIPVRDPPVFSEIQNILKRAVSDNIVVSFVQIIPFDDILTKLTNQLDEQVANPILVQMWVNDGIFNSTAVNVGITIIPLNDKEPQLTFAEGSFVLGIQQSISFNSINLTDADEIVDHRNIIWMSISIQGPRLLCGSFEFNVELLEEGDLIPESVLVDGIRVRARDVNNGAPLERFKEILQSVIYITVCRCSSGEREILFQFKSNVLKSINPSQISSFSYPLIVDLEAQGPRKECIKLLPPPPPKPPPPPNLTS